METMVIRALLALQFRKAGRNDLLDEIRDSESALPFGRYLQPGEICTQVRSLCNGHRAQPFDFERPSDEQLAYATHLWKRYQAAQEGTENDPGTPIKQIHAWEDWLYSEWTKAA